MKPASLVKLVLPLCVLVLSSAPSSAVEIKFTAEVTGYGRTSGSSIASAIEALIPLGSVVTGHISYAPDAEVITSFSYQNGVAVTYRGNGFSAAVGDIFANTNAQDVTVGNGGVGGVDQLVNWADARHNVTVTGAPFPVLNMSVGLYDQPGAVFDTTSLPLAGLSLTDFDKSNFDLSFVRDLQNPSEDIAAVNGRITSLSFNDGIPIPEPSTIALLTIGLLGFAATRRA